MSQPVPFTIVRQPDMPAVATNGATRLTCLDAGGVIRLRRAVREELGAPMAEKLLPHLNALAGELLARSDMPPEELAARLHALQMACRPKAREQVEWAYAELDGVRVYTDGVDVIVTKQDLKV